MNGLQEIQTRDRSNSTQNTNRNNSASKPNIPEIERQPRHTIRESLGDLRRMKSGVDETIKKLSLTADSARAMTVPQLDAWARDHCASAIPLMDQHQSKEEKMEQLLNCQSTLINTERQKLGDARHQAQQQWRDFYHANLTRNDQINIGGDYDTGTSEEKKHDEETCTNNIQLDAKTDSEINHDGDNDDDGDHNKNKNNGGGEVLDEVFDQIYDFGKGYPLLVKRKNSVTKSLYYFDNEQDKQHVSLDKAKRCINIVNNYVFEYYYPKKNQNKKRNKKSKQKILDTDSIYAIVNGNILFKFGNKRQREIFIEAIIETVHPSKHLGDKVFKTKNNKFVYKYKPVHYYSSIKCGNDYAKKLGNGKRKWITIPIKLVLQKMKFILSIDLSSIENAQDGMAEQDLADMIHEMLNNYVGIEQAWMDSRVMFKLGFGYGKITHEKLEELSRNGKEIQIHPAMDIKCYPELNGLGYLNNNFLHDNSNNNNNNDNNVNVNNTNNHMDEKNNGNENNHNNNNHNNNKAITQIKTDMNCFKFNKNMQWQNRGIDFNCFIQEIVSNGCEEALKLQKKDHCYTFLQNVNKYYESQIHKLKYMKVLSRGEIMALRLYTRETDPNYKMSEKQRNGDYQTWLNFDTCLNCAIYSLYKMEDYSFIKSKPFHLYSGINYTQLKGDSKNVNCCGFPANVSTTYIKDTCQAFMPEGGMLLQFDENIIFKKEFILCSLEWISANPHECEILVARTDEYIHGNGATLTVIADNVNSSNVYNNDNINNNDIQIVRVSKYKFEDPNDDDVHAGCTVDRINALPSDELWNCDFKTNSSADTTDIKTLRQQADMIALQKEQRLICKEQGGMEFFSHMFTDPQSFFKERFDENGNQKPNYKYDKNTDKKKKKQKNKNKGKKKESGPGFFF